MILLTSYDIIDTINKLEETSTDRSKSVGSVKTGNCHEKKQNNKKLINMGRMKKCREQREKE